MCLSKDPIQGISSMDKPIIYVFLICYLFCYVLIRTTPTDDMSMNIYHVCIPIRSHCAITQTPTGYLFLDYQWLCSYVCGKNLTEMATPCLLQITKNYIIGRRISYTLF